MELLKNYNCTIEYNLGKANVVANVLSWKLIGNLHYIRVIKMPMLVELRKLNTKLDIGNTDGILAILKVRPLLMKNIARA